MEEVGISSDFLVVLKLIWIFLKGKELEQDIPGGDSNKRNTQKHKTTCLWHSLFSTEDEQVREALSNKEAEDKFKDQIWRGICIGRYKMWVFDN